MSDSEIGRELFISPKTVSVHVANIKAKFGVSTRIEAALRAQAAVGTADTPPG
jgi:DNA-binding NarL/FixJ family response regulator